MKRHADVWKSQMVFLWRLHNIVCAPAEKKQTMTRTKKEAAETLEERGLLVYCVDTNREEMKLFSADVALVAVGSTFHTVTVTFDFTPNDNKHSFQSESFQIILSTFTCSVNLCTCDRPSEDIFSISSMQLIQIVRTCCGLIEEM